MIYLQLVFAIQIIRPKDSAKMVGIGVHITNIKFISEQAPQHYNLKTL